MTKDLFLTANELTSKIATSNALIKALYGAMTGDRIVKITVDVDVHQAPTFYLSREYVEPVINVLTDQKDGWQKEFDAL